MKTIVKKVNGKEVSRKSGYKNEIDAMNAVRSWLNDCSVHAVIRSTYSYEIIDEIIDKIK